MYDSIMLLTLLWKVIFVHLNTTPIYQEYIHLFIVLVFMLLSCSQFILLSHFRIKHANRKEMPIYIDC